MRVEGVQLNSTHAVSQSIPGQGSQQMRGRGPTAKANDREVDFPLKRKVDSEQLDKAIEQANKSFKSFDRRFERSVHEKTNTVMVRVINATNDEVIREIPPEKILDMVAYMLEIAGIIIDEKV